MPWWTPLAMVGGFLVFGIIFVTVSDIGAWIERRKTRDVVYLQAYRDNQRRNTKHDTDR